MEGILPVSFSLQDERRIEEEHRLFYVAVTRARSHLFLSAYHNNEGINLRSFNKISRFIEVPIVLGALEKEFYPLLERERA